VVLAEFAVVVEVVNYDSCLIPFVSSKKSYSAFKESSYAEGGFKSCLRWLTKGLLGDASMW